MLLPVLKHMNGPLVSIIIPTYNRAHYVGDAIESTLAQTYPNKEILVIDDGSTDGTRGLVEKYLPRVQYHHQPNKGASAARNLGIRLSRGDFVAFLDSDDRWLPEKISMQVELLEKHPAVGMVGCGEHCIDARGERFWTGYARPKLDVESLMIRCTAFGGASRPLIRRECFDKAGLFDETLFFNEDWDMWLRIAKHYEIRNVPQPLMEWRAHDTPRPRRAMEFRFEQTRRVIERHVTREMDRRKAYSWMFYESAKVALSQDRDRRRSLSHLLISYRHFPLKVCPEHQRVLLLLENVLPAEVLEKLAGLKRKLKAIGKGR